MSIAPHPEAEAERERYIAADRGAMDRVGEGGCAELGANM